MDWIVRLVAVAAAGGVAARAVRRRRAARRALRRPPFPYPDGRFPDDLPAYVQRTVLDGTRPALVVGHDADGDWYVADGVTDPAQPDAVAVAHLAHVVAHDPSIAGLATMAPGYEATRPAAGRPWLIAKTGRG